MNTSNVVSINANMSVEEISIALNAGKPVDFSPMFAESFEALTTAEANVHKGKAMVRKALCVFGVAVAAVGIAAIAVMANAARD